MVTDHQFEAVGINGDRNGQGDGAILSIAGHGGIKESPCSIIDGGSQSQWFSDSCSTIGKGGFSLQWIIHNNRWCLHYMGQE